MHRGEYSYLLCQVRSGHAEHRRELLVRHTTRPAHYATGACEQVDVAHHPAQGLGSRRHRQ
jgi:hypothetical protein